MNLKKGFVWILIAFLILACAIPSYADESNKRYVVACYNLPYTGYQYLNIKGCQIPNIMGIKEMQGDSCVGIYTTFCLQLGIDIATGDQMNWSSDYSLLDAKQKELVGLALYYGGAAPNLANGLNEISESEFRNYIATQLYIWYIVNNLTFEEAQNYANELGCIENYHYLQEQLNSYSLLPSFLTKDEKSVVPVELKWNPKNESWEGYCTDTNSLLSDKMIQQLNEYYNMNGVSFLNENGLLKISSKVEIQKTKAMTFKITKEYPTSEAVYFMEGSNSRQKSVARQYNTNGTVDGYFGVYTESLGNLELVKKDAITDKYVAGARYGLYANSSITLGNETWQPDELIVTLPLTDDSGHTELDFIPFGTYYLKEIEAPKGYYLSDEKLQVNISEENSLDSLYSASLNVFENPILHNITIHKVGVKEGEIIGNLEHVVFEIYNYDTLEGVLNGTLVDDFSEYCFDQDVPIQLENNSTSIETDENGVAVVKGLYSGKYVIVEKETLVGYVIGDAYLVEFSGDQDTKTEHEIIIKNDAIHTKVEIHKRQTNHTANLEGAKLALYDNNHNCIEEWITNNEGHVFEYLLPGTYYLEELSAPDGYKIAETIEFQVKETQEEQIIVMYDDIIPVVKGTSTEITTERITSKINTSSVPTTGDSVSIIALIIIMLLSIVLMWIIRKK